MSHLQDGASSSVGRDDASLSDYSALEMADLSPLLDVGAGQPANMELYEMEGYVLQSLELLASTPTPQYYGPEIVHSEALPRSPLAAPPPAARYDRWDGRTSFQQVHGVIEGQEQPCYIASPPSSSGSPAALPTLYTQLNYHNNMMPEDPSAGEGSNSQGRAVEPSLKRQRNTAASARFRAKKKRNEQIQAQNAREREAVINKLENRVTELETENRWLKDLLIDKAEATSRNQSNVIADERKGYEHKDGVGTSAGRNA